MNNAGNQKEAVVAKTLSLGIDIGGTNTLLGVVDGEGAFQVRSSFSTLGQNTVEDFVERLTDALDTLLRQLPGDARVCGIGLAAPAARHREGIIKDPANLHWGTVHLVDILKRQYQFPVAITNDSNAAALGEMKYGAAKGLRDFIVMTLGTGLGAGVVVDGRLLYGNNDMAGELGHVLLEVGGRRCGCSRRGCAETYISASGLKRTAFELLARDTDTSALRGISYQDLTSRRIYELAVEGDIVARKAFEVTGGYLGRLLANSVAAFDPKAVFLSGGLAEAGEMLLGPTRKSFDESVLGLHKGAVTIMKSSLNNGDAAILGASSLVIEHAGGAATEGVHNQVAEIV